MQPFDEGVDPISQGFLEEDVTYSLPPEHLPELHADFRRYFGYDPFDDDDID
ncbi:hypothetical protein P879_07086 [Paragonimus westermani]|uniref:Uncharacterized protein n=1 Tax=Paragonimus westermani TaxID=34504 RepID=A0A8T0DQI3_9TREM|nr:hypothetical protein P879_07086 [Paragonimus westermani]